ncbi:ABC transporter substrate-binding protein [Halobacteria archaeon HArc-gm2]|nr:ABC transporter substrate-binding protein [Halobacteria archaeon HArc-gm2]
MQDQTDSTRRRFLTGASVALGTAVAGCSQGGVNDASTPTADDTANGETTTETPTASQTSTDGSYTASLSPAGEVAFDAVPENVFTVYPQYLDMAVALGHGETVNSVYVPEMSGTTMNHYYHHLDGVSVEWEGLRDPLADGLPRELLYELDSDVHLADPAWVSTQDGWSQSDVDEVDSQLAPWFGNFYSGTNESPPKGYDDYQYYTLWELFGNVADVFQERERYEALAQVHTDLVSTIQADLPPEEERPTAVRVTLSGDGESFWTYHLNKPGYWLADTRPLGARDAFAEEDWNGLWGTVDYEAMLEADPDVILHLWGMTPNYSMADTRETLESNSAGQTLSAVENDRVYPAGMRYQGPIMNLFQIEMGAKQLYPDVFGEWPDYEDGQHYPEIPEEEQLFDRQRLADIVNGDN